MSKTKFLSKAPRANDISELIRIFDGFLVKPENEFGVTKSFRVSIDKTRREANRKALAVLKQIDNPLLVTNEQKEILRGYTGEGNIGGSTDEYYTPTWLASGMWDMLKEYGGAQGNILEPSAGTGVFNGSKPTGVIMTATELSSTSSKINQILHPEDEVKNTNFEKFAADSSTDGTFDAVVGNVPFGSARGNLANDDPSYAHLKTKETYFVSRAIDKAKPGAYITLVVPQNIVGAASLSKFRATISRKAEFLGAHKIAAGAFSNQGSESVVTDVLIMRKHSEELAELVANGDTKTLRESNVLWAQFITGKWFDKDGKRFINGEVVKGAANFDRDLVAIPNLPKGENGKQLTAEQGQVKSDMIDTHNQATAKSLSKKFESRIDWDRLNLTEQAPINYIEGDQRQINGRWHEYIDSEWLPIKLSNSNGLIDADKFGTNSINNVTELVSTPENALALNFKHLKNIHENFGDKTSGVIANAFTLASKHPAGHQERIVKGALIGTMIENYTMQRVLDPVGAETTRIEIQAQLNATFDRLGTSHDVKGLKRVKGDQTASYYQSFVNAMNSDGTFSDLMKGELDTSSTVAFDTTNAQRTIDMLSHAIGHASVPLDAFRESFTGELPEHVDIDDDNSLLDYLSDFDNIAIDNNGQLSPLDRATSGNITKRKAAIMHTLANEHATDKQKANANRQLDAITKNRKWTKTEDIHFDLRGKWLPRQMVVEFLQENGYDDFSYSDIKVDDDGNVTEQPGYEGSDGLFTGYFSKDGKKVPSNDDNRFIRQVEKYLNGQTVQGKNGVESSKYREQVRQMESEFQLWAQQHPDVKLITERYNDSFNGNIQFDHDDSPLNLDGVSGNIVNMGYQNSGIRRLSEEGRGILGFGTGLGKTFTALGLVAYNTKEKRSKRTCIVVPKSVTENWINETIDFYGYDNISKTVFVGFDFVKNEEGVVQTQPILNEDGTPKLHKTTDNPKTTPVLKESSAEDIATKMHKIPHSNCNLVIMSKEQFARIPMKPATIQDNAAEHMGNLSATGKIDVFADSYKKQQAKEAALAKLVKEGSEKEYDYPFFEDMHFDTVIVDEGHNYRNSQEAGKNSRQLVYLSAGGEAKVAADMRQKMQFLGRKQNGRGAVLLTATPTPNSPLDIYNMLSHVLTPEEWLAMGIANQDDFINVFGETSEVQIGRLDGSQAMAQGLTGFKNLDGLRSLFDTYCNRKNIKDVASDTTVPEIINSNTVVDMNEEQQDAYDLLRLRAEIIRASSSEGGIETLLNFSGKSPAEQQLIEQIIETYPDDQIFSVMRDMERVTSDIELYNQRMTFVFPKEKAKQAQALIDNIKTPITIQVRERNQHGEMENVKRKVDLNAEITINDDGLFVVSINDKFESALIAGLNKQKLTQGDVSHPVSPKYARLLANLKESFEAGGKQIIFTEEKSQHKKLHRIICHHLGLKPNQVGILNGSTVTGDESAINEDSFKKMGAAAAKKKREELEAQGLDTSDVDQEGLETIAKRYNQGQFRVLICNKKAEVGVNLHIQTTDIHHLSLPWTPASIDQRNGRGARVGAPQSHVNSHFYLAKGSFDQFRLDTINRKRKWQNDLIDGTASRADNGDADDDNDTGLLLANNPEEYAAMLEIRKRELEEKLQKSKVESANYTLEKYLLSAALAKQNIGHLEGNERDAADALVNSQARLQREEVHLQDAQKTLDESQDEYSHRWLVDRNKRDVAKAKKNNREKNSALKRAQNKLKGAIKAKQQVLRLKPQVQAAIDNGVLKLDPELIDNPTSFIHDKVNSRAIRIGNTYFIADYDYGNFAVIVTDVLPEEGGVKIEALSAGPYLYGVHPVSRLQDEVIISKTITALSLELKTTYGLSNCYNLLDRNLFNSLVENNIVPEKLPVLTLSNGKYNVKAYQYVSDKSTVIFLDKSDSVIKEQLALIYIESAKTGSTQEHLVTEALKFLFGEHYVESIVKYNPDAETNEELAQFVEREIVPLFSESYQLNLNEAVHTGKIAYPALKLKGELNALNKVPGDIFRKDALKTAISDRIVEELALFESESTSKRDSAMANIKQRFSAAEGSAIDDVAKRLLTLDESMFIGNSLYMKQYTLEFIEETLPKTAYADHVETMITDLRRIGYRTQISTDLATPEILQEAYAKIHNEVGRDISLLQPYLPKDESTEPVKAEQPPAPAIESDGDNLDASAIPYAAILKEKFNIVCKRNTLDMELKSFRGKVFASGEPYEYIGFYDPAGKGGALHDALSPIKRRKKAVNGADASSEFDGFWWFVKADLDTQTVLDAFDL
ncbi:DEAD/DEAH box helicase family protein (plasmid) [Moritella sp. 24]|uniref:SNF2-related protein n=1 Tax=Moritella sp. 24 TaxID=2746230 RepID=UPI001BA95280|nr:SNF2-related protein [Moritella sp. 24]QUM78727.1 DEAD/DEAH box helicase family protein [Moritella sp. 24]